MDKCSAVMLSGHKPQVADAVIEALATSEMSRFKEGLCESEHDDRCKEASDTLKREPTPGLGTLSKIFFITSRTVVGMVFP